MRQKGLSLVLLIILSPIVLVVLTGILLFAGVIHISTSGPTAAPLDKVQTTPTTTVPTSNPSQIPLSTINPSPSTTPTTSGSLNLTNSDELKTFQVKLGDTINLSLIPMEGSENWVVDTPDPKILSLISDSGTKTYKVVGTGTTKITATEQPHCDPGQACPMHILEFLVTITSSADTAK